MEKENNQLLEQYIYKLYKLKIDNQQRLTKELLREVASEIGLSDNELKEIEIEASRHAERAESYISVKRFKDAEAEFNKALELSPLNEEFLIKQADLYLKFYRRKAKRKHVELAISITRNCLEIAPSYKPAILLFDEIRKIRKRKRFLFWLKSFVFVIFFLFTSLFTYVVIRESKIFIKPHGLEGVEYNIPVEIAEDEKTNDLVFQFSEVKIKHESYKASRYFDCLFYLMVYNPNSEVRQLALKGLFLNDKGTKMAEEYYWLFNSDKIVLQPGDCIYFDQSNTRSTTSFENTEPQKISILKLITHQVKRYAAATEYTDIEPYAYSWLSNKPKYLDFEIRIRYNNIAVLNETDKSSFQEIILAITHTGTQICRQLVINIAWFDANGREIENTDYLVFEPEATPLQPKRTVVYEINQHFYEKPWGYPVPFKDFKIRLKSAQ